MSTTEDRITIEEIKKMGSEFKGFKCPKYIKMKQEYYDRLVGDVQRKVNIIEVRNVNIRPLHTLYELKIVIDNKIKKDFEVIYE